MKRALVLCGAAGAAVSLAHAAFGQQTEVAPLPIGPRVVAGSVGTDRGLTLMPVYNAVYDLCPSTPAAFGNGCSYVMEDVSFEPGPWGTQYNGPRDVMQVDYMFQTAGWTGTVNHPGTNTPTCRISHIFEFYEPGNFTNCPMLGNTTALAIRVVESNYGSGFAWNATSPPFDTPVSLGTRVNVWVAIKAIDPITGNRMADGNTGLLQPTGQTAVNYGIWAGRVGLPCVGSTTEDWARDQNPDGPVGSPDDFCGGSTLTGSFPGNTNDRRRTALDFAAGARVLTLGLRGAVAVPAPTTTYDIGGVVDGVTPMPFAVQGTLLRWVRVTLANPVTDEALRMLSIDTEGSNADLALALYAEDGTLLATDEDSGHGPNAQLTFGMGRSAGVGDGAQYDGRDGQLPAGVYYIGVARGGAAFSQGFVVSLSPAPPDVPRVGYVNIRTNANNGDALPPAVPPVINHFDFLTLGPAWTFPASDTFQGTTGDGNPNPNPNDDDSSAVLWNRFAIGETGADAGHYLDVDFGTSDYSDNVAYLFNDAGDLVAFSDDQSSPNALPILSFGASVPPRSTGPTVARGAANDPSSVWEGQDGQLPPGTYYLASAAWPAEVMTGPNGAAPTLGTGRRWHVRGLSTSNIGMTVDYYTGTGSACDSIDFNRDGFFPDTADLADFLSVMSGGPCSNGPNCGDIDFNNDQLYPDTADIQSLLRVFSGGPCL
ncbi:MAG TPA: hypothetical protein VHN77_11765 [Phycisphaerales bacterium]|nr:hypothetical protein [Phycisphaerales bacterium]